MACVHNIDGPAPESLISHPEAGTSRYSQQNRSTSPECDHFQVRPNQSAAPSSRPEPMDRAMGKSLATTHCNSASNKPTPGHRGPRFSRFEPPDHTMQLTRPRHRRNPSGSKNSALTPGCFHPTLSPSTLA